MLKASIYTFNRRGGESEEKTKFSAINQSKKFKNQLVDYIFSSHAYAKQLYGNVLMKAKLINKFFNS